MVCWFDVFWSNDPLVRRPIGSMARWFNEPNFVNPLIRRLCGPTAHRSDGQWVRWARRSDDSLIRRPIDTTAHWFSGPLIRRPFRMYVRMYEYIHECMYLCLYVCVYVYIYIYMYLCTYVCMYVCM